MDAEMRVVKPMSLALANLNQRIAELEDRAASDARRALSCLRRLDRAIQ
jgi:hypothetical protein